MNEIIKVDDKNFNNKIIKTVNARDIHSYLGVGRDFSTWVKKQIERARLVDGRDYTTVTLNGEGGKFSKIDYHLTLDSGKHVAMLSGTEKGFEVREYFIECEKKSQIEIPSTLPEALRLAADLAEKNNILSEQIKLDAPKVQFADAVGGAVSSIGMSEYAKAISGQSGFVIGRTNLFKLLRDCGLLDKKNLPHQVYLDMGWFEVRESWYETSASKERMVYMTTMITGKGQVKILEKIKSFKNLDKYVNKAAVANRSFIISPAAVQ